MHTELIINADDFGMFSEANRGILYCAEKKLINSVSISVNYFTQDLDFKSVLNYELESLGLHVNLTEGVSLISNDKMPDALTLLKKPFSVSLYYDEILSQVEAFKNIYGFNPQHIDCHQHFAYIDPQAFEAFLNISEQFNIPMRSPINFVDAGKFIAFCQYIKKHYAVDLLIDANKRSLQLNNLLKKFNVPHRSNDAILHIDSKTAHQIQNNAELASIELVCHPQISQENIHNNDLIFLENTLTL